jgi:hypothetical protein
VSSPEDRRIFESARDHLNEASLKNTEALDKAILALSSSGLALSISFIRSIVPMDEAIEVWILKAGWLLFVLALMSTVISFLASSSAIIEERKQIYAYYIQGDEQAGFSSNLWGFVTYWINRIAVLAFVLGVIMTVIFVWLNT